MTPDVVKVKALANHCLEAEFETGEVRRFDMKPYLAFPAFAALKENGLFMRGHVAYGTVAWNDEIDLSPGTLYLGGFKSEEQAVDSVPSNDPGSP